MEKDYTKHKSLLEDSAADMDEETPLLNSKTAPRGSKVENILIF